MTGTYHLKEFFFGGNTCRGFFSRQQELYTKGFNRVFILKGGPGTGKSTLIKKIAHRIVQKGYAVELYCCASDSRSLDGLGVPSLGVIIVDGTFPHIIDPELPGIRDEIINLGSYWKEEHLKKYSLEIHEYKKEIAAFFDIAYRYLKEARIAYIQWQGFYTRCLNKYEAAKYRNLFINEIFDGVKPLHKPWEEQRLFASAITPEGPVNKYHLILQDIENFHLLLGEPGTGKTTLLEHVYFLARRKGLMMEAYPCGFDPQRLDALVLPEISTAFIKHCYPHNFCLTDIRKVNTVSTFDLSLYLDQKKIQRCEPEINDAQERYWHLLKMAVKNIDRARTFHGKLEKYYSGAQDFSRLDQVTEELYQKILTYIR